MSAPEEPSDAPLVWSEVPIVPHESPPSLLSRVLYSFPAVFVFLCYTLTAFPIARYALPRLAPLYSYLYWSLLSLTLFLWLRLAIFLPAGSVPPQWLRNVSLGLVPRHEITLCPKCRCVRPPRAHHCRRCGRCVLLFDHHCPFTGGCVGHFTRKPFLQYVASTTMFTSLCFILLVQSIPWTRGAHYSYCLRATPSSWSWWQQWLPQLLRCFPYWMEDSIRSSTLWIEMQLVMSAVLASGFTLGCIVLGSYHIRLAMRNVTTCEDGMGPDEWDLGSAAQNVRQITGPSIVWGMLSLNYTGYGDGTSYPVKQSKKDKKNL